MRKKLALNCLVTYVACLLCSAAQAQCGGINTGGGNCTPPTAPGMPNYDANTARGSLSTQPSYTNQWGAIAIDGHAASAGTVTGRASESEATNAAMTECKEKGGTKCRVALTYENQCGAVAWTPGSYATGASTTAEAAEEKALTLCNKDDASCKIVYSGCSLPRRIN